MGTKHKHADTIIAWANGANIEIKAGNIWRDCINPIYWHTNSLYRVKRVFKDWEQKLIDAAKAGEVVQYHSRLTNEWKNSALYYKVVAGEDVYSYVFSDQDRYRIKPEEVEPTVQIERLTITGTKTLPNGDTEPYTLSELVGAVFKAGDTYNFKLSFSE